MSYTYGNLMDMWRRMLKAQNDKDNFTLTIRELMEIFELRSTSAVIHRLHLLEQAGFVDSILSGSKRTYRARLEPDIDRPYKIVI